jgi:hypothetical protein
MGVGPLVAGAGLLLLVRVNASGAYMADVLPGVLVFGLGLSATVAPLTATVLAGAPAHHSGIASGVNNAVARVAGLLAIAVVGTVVAAQFTHVIDSRLPQSSLGPQTRHVVEQARSRSLVTNVSGVPPADRPRVHDTLESASVKAYRVGMAITGLLTIAGGVISLIGIEGRLIRVKARGCPGGAICGAGEDVRLPAGGAAAARAS